MRDNREQIPEGTKLPGSGTMSGTTFTVTELVGRGGSCMVYNAFSTDRYGIRHEYILKQLFPLPRESGNPVQWDTVRVSEAELKRFMKASAVQQQLSGTMVNTTPVIHSIFTYADTVYFQCLERNFGISMERMHFDSLYDLLDVLVKSAGIISAYHQEGWLHLDIKPQNLFCKSSGQSTSVIMIDFDSLIRMEDVPDTSITLSYSQGYAPPELIHNKREQISISSDFYELSCILFEKLFGRSPSSAEVGGFTRYRFSARILGEAAPKALTDALTQFFRHTLTVRPSERYDSDEKFIAALREIMQLSKKRSYQIISNFTAPFVFFIGREDEMDSIHALLQKHGKAIVQGVGGIGKSSVALHYAERYRDDYRAILRLEYHGSFEDLIDEEIQIDELPADASRSEKWELFRSLCNEETLVILDNLEQTGDELEKDWLSLPCHLIVTTRSSQEQFRDITLQLPGLREAKELFCHYYTEPLSEDENALVDRLLFTLGSHTMMTELLGKYCCNCRNKNGSVDFAGLLEAFEKADTAEIEPENVKQIKDLSLRNKSLQNHMDVLFSVFSFTAEEISILQSMALIPLKSVSEKLFSDLYRSCSSEALETLKGSGMLQTDAAGFFKLHPLIAERILANYPPEAAAFAYTSEKLVDFLMMEKRHSFQLFMKIGAHYIAHMHGADKSLAFLCQTMAYLTSKEQSKSYAEKAIALFAEVGCEELLYYLSIQAVADQYLALDIFDEETFDEKANAACHLLELLDEASKHMPEFKEDLHCEQIAGECHRITGEEMFWPYSDNYEDDPIRQFEAVFLEMAFEACNIENARKRIAGKLADFYGDLGNPLSDYVKETKYYQIADNGPKVYNPETNERYGNTSQSHDADLLNALIASKRYDEALVLADEWYARHFEEDTPLESYLQYQMRNTYQHFEQWNKYILLLEEDKEKAGDNWQLSLGIAYHHTGDFERSYIYLQKEMEAYASAFGTVLDWETEDYLRALGYLAWWFPDREPDILEKFWRCTESFYMHSLCARGFDMPSFFLMRCESCLKNGDPRTAGRFLGLFARYRQILSSEEELKFEEFRTQVETSGYAAFWCDLVHIAYLNSSDQEKDRIAACEKLLQSPEAIADERYRQLIYEEIKLFDTEYLLQHYADKIDFVLLDEMELESHRSPDRFESRIEDRIYIAKQYHEIGSQQADVILKGIIQDIRTYAGGLPEKAKAFQYIEKYYHDTIEDDSQALQFALESYTTCRSQLPPEELAPICRRIATYYQNRSEPEQQLHWLQTALDELTAGDNGSKAVITEALEIHDSLLAYYEEADDVPMQLRECHDIETLLLSLRDKQEYYVNQLIDIYHKLSALYLRQHNLTQAYYYSALEEELIQERLHQ